MDELIRYAFNWCPQLLSPTEREAHKHLIVAKKINAAESAEQKELMSKRWLSADSSVLRLLENGDSVFYETVMKRLEAEKQLEGMLNNCPRCAGLARTPEAKQCPHCYFSWH